jgi:hypothetical protein
MPTASQTRPALIVLELVVPQQALNRSPQCFIRIRQGQLARSGFQHSLGWAVRSVERLQEIPARDSPAELSVSVNDGRGLPASQGRVPEPNRVGKLRHRHTGVQGDSVAIHHVTHANSGQRIDTMDDPSADNRDNDRLRPQAIASGRYGRHRKALRIGPVCDQANQRHQV